MRNLLKEPIYIKKKKKRERQNHGKIEYSSQRYVMETVLNIDNGHRGLHSCIQLSKLIEPSLSLAFFEFSRRLNFARLFLTRAVSDTKFKDLKSCLTMQNQGSPFLHCVSPSPNHRKFHKRWSACLSSLLCLVLQHKPHGLACPAPTPQHSPSCQTQAGSFQIPAR